MTPISENALDRLLFEYCEKEPAHPFVYKPQSKQSPPPVSVFRRYKVLAFAATVVLVVGMSLSVYFFFGNKSAVPIAPSPISSNSQPSEMKAATDAAKAPLLSPSSPAGNTEPTAPKNSTSPSSSAAPFATEKKEGTVAPTLPGKGPAEPTESPKPTVSPTRPAETTSPSVVPTDEPWMLPTEAPIPTESPTIRIPPTELPWNPPTEPPWVLPTMPPEPTEPPQPTEPADEIVFIGVFPWEPDYDNEDSWWLYCRIYDQNGNLVGDPDLFSESHKASYLIWSGITNAYYRPADYGIRLSTGRYTYFFYDINGVDVYKGEQYVQTHHRRIKRTR